MRSRPYELFFAGVLALFACGEPDQAPQVIVLPATAAGPNGPTDGALQVPAIEEHNDVTRGGNMNSNRPSDRDGPAPGGGSTVNVTTGNTGGQAGEPGTSGAGATTTPGDPGPNGSGLTTGPTDPVNPAEVTVIASATEDAGVPPTSEESF
jgi:hypothetical protein